MRVDRWIDNLRTALHWYAARAEAEEAQRLSASLSRYWYLRGYLSEARNYLDGVLYLRQPDAFSGRRVAARASACHAAGYMAWRQGDYAAARSLQEECLTLFRKLDDRRGIGSAFNSLGELAEDEGDFATADRLFRESLVIFRTLGDRWMIAMALTNVGEVAVARGKLFEAGSLLSEAFTMFRGLGDRWGAAVAMKDLGELIQRGGNSRFDLSRLAESLITVTASADSKESACSLNAPCDGSRRFERSSPARSLFIRSLILFQQLGDRVGIAFALEGLARAAAIESDAKRGLRLAGAAAALRAATGTQLRPGQLEYHQRVIRAAEMKTARSSALWAQGRAMPLQEAVAYAVGQVHIAVQICD
jgi:tetratricopeptide (TPR) repeat protein